MTIGHGKKYLSLMIIVCIFISFLSGCGSDIDRKDIYENDRYIAQEGDMFSFYKREGDENEKYIDIKYSGFYGAQTLWVIQSQENSEIKLSFDSAVKSGSFKIVIITPEQELINITEQDNNGTFKIDVSPGKYKVKIVGKNASGKLRIELAEQENNIVTVQDNKL